MTETGGGLVYDGLPLDSVEIRVADGEIQLRAPMLLRCYRDGTDPRTADGWFPTGDGGTFDDGVLAVDGRLADVIVTGGEKVWPGPVEERLRGHPDVAEVAVVGRPDDEWGATVTAVVVASDPAAPPALDDLRDHVKATLPGWCAPRGLEVVETLPRTSLGKIRRGLL
jgi:O-succinylbenzoic acid--CoA ligase